MRSRPLVTLILLLCFIALVAQSASAQQLINLNFSATPYAGTTETSPATPSGPAGTWNNLTNNTLNAAGSVETDATTVPILLADGSNGPTLTFDASGGTSSSNAWNGDSGVAFMTRDFTTASGVYDVPNLYEAGLVNGSNGRTAGFRIKGLAAGNYEVFVVPFYRNEVQAGAKVDTAKIYIGLGNDTDARNAGDYTLTSTLANPTTNVDTTLTTWMAATDGSTAYNYVGATVAIDSTSRWLTFLFEPAAVTTGGDRPATSVIQLRSTSAPVELLGDFNQNNKVDAADYVIWREKEGLSTTLPNSGTLTGPIGQDHYDLWRSHFGNGTGSGSATALYSHAVPEPCTLPVAIVIAATMWVGTLTFRITGLCRRR